MMRLDMLRFRRHGTAPDADGLTKAVPPLVVKRLRGLQSAKGVHLDADLLAAFAQGNVSSRERTFVTEHLAECSDCREVCALGSAPLERPLLDAPAVRQRPIQRGWRVAAAAAIVCVGMAGIWQAGWTGRPAVSRPMQAVPKAQTAQGAVAPAAPLPPALPTPQIARSKQLAKAKRAAAPSIVAVPPVSSSELAELTQSFAAANSREGAKQVIVIPNGDVPGGSLREALSNPALRNQLRNQDVQGNALFASSAGSPLTLVVQAPVATEQRLWSLEGVPRDGTVKRSADGGRTWQVITVDGETPLYALSAPASAIWVGGSGGKLFHSTDDGVSWTPVLVVYQGTPIRDGVVSVEAHGATVRVTTAAGMTFATGDSGSHWRRE